MSDLGLDTAETAEPDLDDILHIDTDKNGGIIAGSNPQLLRKSVLATSTMVTIYNIFVFSIGGIANEVISIISSIIGIIRYRKATVSESGKLKG